MTYPPTSSRQQAVANARSLLQANPVFLDTETTGLGDKDEIVEISIVDAAGVTLVNQFVKPKIQIPASATQIHGITNEMVQGAKSWPILWMSIKPILANRMIVAYNSDFDHRMMLQSYRASGIKWQNLQMFDLMKLYAQFRGEWDSQRGAWRNFSLDAAGKSAGIDLPNSHRSLADTLLARALFMYIAEYQG